MHGLHGVHGTPMLQCRVLHNLLQSHTKLAAAGMTCPLDPTGQHHSGTLPEGGNKKLVPQYLTVHKKDVSLYVASRRVSCTTNNHWAPAGGRGLLPAVVHPLPDMRMAHRHM
uniref:Uncharacterized protein n=1 Tax=Eutreptiella gymnastica TaxID=73025 RepID=A0A7S4C817_9EUGL|mmetsp:Transcript_103701/g.175483  ORF Transcript_103701/g.175483 Transcript_103701/m.175483 type:complete len:112 (+) Transcript_103701:142-477(+)